MKNAFYRDVSKSLTREQWSYTRLSAEPQSESYNGFVRATA